MNAVDETREVREAHRFDEQRLARWLEGRLPGMSGALQVRQFRGGQSNPTFLLAANDRRWVLRKKPPGVLLPSAHMVEREFRILSALAESDVPVPRAHLSCEDPDVIGTPFYVMDYVAGRIFRSPLMPDARSNDERAAIVDAMNDTLARLHRFDYAAAGLSDFGKPGNYMARQVARWSQQYLASKTGEVPSMTLLGEWLPAHVPADDTTSIAHGDFRLENLIVHPDEPRVLAVLDWELSTLGHPLADLGYNCMLYHLPEGAFAGSGYGTDPARFGIPSEDEYVAAYCRRTGRDGVPDLDFYVAFGMYRLAAIVQGVYKRGLDGNASSETATMYGPVVEFLADTAWGLVGRRP
jgi:aminoglycoside phosphotransferase (APT) family kinase protein